MGITASLSARQLRPHQVAAHDDLVASLAVNDRALFVSACGTGKTITMQSVANSIAPTGLIGAFFPSLFLIGQTLREWRTQYEGRWNTPIVVCSDKSVADDLDDEARLSPEEIEAFGATVTTDPNRLAALLVEATPGRPQVVFATYQSSDKVASAQRLLATAGRNPEFDLVVLDEAHRVTPGSALGLHVLDSASILSRKRLAATATPRQFHISADGDRADDGDLLDEAVYGPVAHEYGMRQAIEEGVLCDYQVHATVIAEERVGTLAGLDDDELRLRLGVAALRRAHHQLGAGRIIAYLKSVSRARRFAAMAQEAGLSAYVITGEDPADERRAALNAAFVQSSHAVVANVRCLTEGVDIPTLDAVLFVDPRKDKIDTVQAVGRAIRQHPGKRVGHVIIPVLAGRGDRDSWMEQAGWDIMTSVLAQIADNDTAIRSELTAYASTVTGSGAGYPAMSRVRFDLGADDEIDLGDRPYIAFDKLIAAMSLRAVRVLDVDWDWKSRLEAVLDFSRRYGRLPSRYAAGSGETALARWLAKQRQNATPTQAARLDERVPGWRVTRRSEMGWLRNFHALVDYHTANGRMPRNNASDPTEAKVAEWARVQRRNADLSPERLALLENRFPDVGWVARDRPLWEERFEALSIFIGEHARLPRPNDGAEAFRLRGWYQQQSKSKRLTVDKIARLDERMPGWRRNRYTPPD